MTTLATEIKRSTWSVLPKALHDAGTLAFPNCKSPRSVPNDKWDKLVMAYKTWHYIFCSDDLGSFVFFRGVSIEKQQQYLNDIAVSIAKE